ncbi:MAG: pantoate--beta-alanine ligase [Deltaproteobacteria bacterium]|nr:pantoate--beta-alanine ligase [Deltaproteobacteria bacterium]
MEALQSLLEMKTWSQKIRAQGLIIGFVPTMGALHEGHLSLVRQAKKNCDRTVVSIFVNPLQFGLEEDLDQYPQNLEHDFELLKKENIDVVFVPKPKEIYPLDFQTAVEVSGLSKQLCGKSRSGHFRGVATVVLKLFNIVNPTKAFFGNKDFQQRVIIDRLVKDLHLDVEVVACPIVREADGLAMSSRNVYLSIEERKSASVLYRALQHGRRLFQSGERRSSKIIAQVREMIDKENPKHIDYAQVCDVETLEEVSEVQTPSVLAVAVHFGQGDKTTRLIDNVVLDSNGE